MLDQTQTNLYLSRIGIAAAAADAETLANLHRQHLLHIPFENLDVHNGCRIVLDEDALFAKVVLRRRGGFCYELNSLFGALLDALGYDCRLISAQVYDAGKGGYGADCDHMALLVQMGSRRYLADVGFGALMLLPLDIDRRGIQSDPCGGFAVSPFDSRRYRLDKQDGGSLTPKYLFSPEPRQLDDFAAMCAYHQTDPASYFVRNRLATLARPDGRLTLLNDTLKIQTADGLTQRQISGEEEYRRVLSDCFGIVL